MDVRPDLLQRLLHQGQGVGLFLVPPDDLVGFEHRQEQRVLLRLLQRFRGEQVDQPVNRLPVVGLHPIQQLEDLGADLFVGEALELLDEGGHPLQRLLGPQLLDLLGLALGAAEWYLVVHRATSCSTLASTSAKLPSTGSLNPVPNSVSTASTSTTTVSAGSAPK